MGGQIILQHNPIHFNFSLLYLNQHTQQTDLDMTSTMSQFEDKMSGLSESMSKESRTGRLNMLRHITFQMAKALTKSPEDDRLLVDAFSINTESGKCKRLEPLVRTLQEISESITYTMEPLGDDQQSMMISCIDLMNQGGDKQQRKQHKVMMDYIISSFQTMLTSTEITDGQISMLGKMREATALLCLLIDHEWSSGFQRDMTNFVEAMEKETQDRRFNMYGYVMLEMASGFARDCEGTDYWRKRHPYTSALFKASHHFYNKPGPLIGDLQPMMKQYLSMYLGGPRKQLDQQSIMLNHLISRVEKEPMHAYSVAHTTALESLKEARRVLPSLFIQESSSKEQDIRTFGLLMDWSDSD